MTLHKFKDFYPNYRETFGDGILTDFDSYSVYTERDEQVGSVKNFLVDQSGRFRYVVVETGFWIFGKNVLLPIGLARFDYDNTRIYVDGLSRQQVEELPEYHAEQVVDEVHENRVRAGYQPQAQQRAKRQFMGQTYTTDGEYYTGDRKVAPATSGLSGLSSDDAPREMVAQTQGRTAAGQNYNYDYDREPSYYGLSEQDNHEQLRLYEERLITDKSREKSGEVRVGKRVETETAEASVPVKKERVVIERNDLGTGRSANVASGSPTFDEGEVARMEVYEEEVSIEKQPFVREEVNIRKEVDRQQVRAKETVRREELDVRTEGSPPVERLR
ncbi:MAG: DUF2382 domain-containing protein [Leptolyngbyaceae cyanobacterium SM1_1_3]|nr:DUF2382 domain-containing protein [Leptolyngbyaceae cyanobacterium SM1_1_3]NJN04830.1 DUF2382 domain-containing protein [Leptolyngbyaceae cyanobacterium RM1_1_2]NJO11404.1 DUF2382 domain-containing protein [Leptolyngbyaceae cyanobacterium SL_1_1]